MRRLLPLLLLCGCANRVALYTEDGLRAAEQVWDAEYNRKADACEQLHQPQTPEMERCFGSYYDADAKVDTAVGSAVALLRIYWTARAQGKQPDLRMLQSQLGAIVDSLPNEAKLYFERVKGLLP